LVRARDEDQSDAQLAAAAAGGDRRATDALLRRHTDRIHGICRRVLGNEQDALDATQQALIAIVRGLPAFDGRSQFTTWCYRIATNAAIDEGRRRNRRPVPIDTLPDRPAAARATDEAVADRLDIDSALGALPDVYRAAVALRDLAGLEYAEIGEILDLPPGTVRSRIARGRAALADALGNPPIAPQRPTPRTP
jgi:RNA polymerase sigma-70 factor (ECF subfamily)